MVVTKSQNTIMPTSPLITAPEKKPSSATSRTTTTMPIFTYLKNKLAKCRDSNSPNTTISQHEITSTCSPDENFEQQIYLHAKNLQARRLYYHARITPRYAWEDPHTNTPSRPPPSECELRKVWNEIYSLNQEIRSLHLEKAGWLEAQSEQKQEIDSLKWENEECYHTLSLLNGIMDSGGSFDANMWFERMELRKQVRELEMEKEDTAKRLSQCYDLLDTVDGIWNEAWEEKFQLVSEVAVLRNEIARLKDRDGDLEAMGQDAERSDHKRNDSGVRGLDAGVYNIRSENRLGKNYGGEKTIHGSEERSSHPSSSRRSNVTCGASRRRCVHFQEDELPSKCHMCNPIGGTCLLCDLESIDWSSRRL
jgi:hypothetical protein